MNRIGNGRRACALALGTMMLLGACSSADEGAAVAEKCDVAVDLQTARDTVIEARGYGTWDQVMLASDVDGPTQKYGLLVMPLVKSDAAETVTGTVPIEGEKFTIDATSKATGATCRIDQDGAISIVEGE